MTGKGNTIILIYSDNIFINIIFKYAAAYNSIYTEALPQRIHYCFHKNKMQIEIFLLIMRKMYLGVMFLFKFVFLYTEI